MRRDGLSVLKACSYIFYLEWAFVSHVTWNSAVPDPNVWCCILLFFCTLGTTRICSERLLVGEKAKPLIFARKKESCFPKVEHTWNVRTKASLRHWKREKWNTFQNIWKNSNTPQGSVFLEWTIVHPVYTCKTAKTYGIRHLFGLGGWVSINPIIVRIFRNVR